MRKKYGTCKKCSPCKSLVDGIKESLIFKAFSRFYCYNYVKNVRYHVKNVRSLFKRRDALPVGDMRRHVPDLIVQRIQIMTGDDVDPVVTESATNDQ